MVVVLVGVQGSLILLYVYSKGISEMIGHKLWLPILAWSLGDKIPGDPWILKPQELLRKAT